MAIGFIYVVATLTGTYRQRAFCNVPTEWGDRLYFGPCKRSMRPRMQPGDFVFGLSPSSPAPRRLVFAAEIEERISFAEAYQRFPDLRGPAGPVHVRPTGAAGALPGSGYEHIDGAMHPDEWKLDLATPALDAFFVCRRRQGWVGRWLGPDGPVIDAELLQFLKTCAVYGKAGRLSDRNEDATLGNPVAHGRLYTGLHLETNEPGKLLSLCESKLASSLTSTPASPPVLRQTPASGCARTRGRQSRTRCG
jgi:hypothetical protein